MDMEDDDELVNVVASLDTDDVIMVTSQGQSIRFSVSELRSSSRTSGGVIGIRLSRNDQVVSLSCVDDEAFLLTCY